MLTLYAVLLWLRVTLLFYEESCYAPMNFGLDDNF